MNANLHPVMVAALAPFIHKPLIPGLSSFDYTLAGVDLDCAIEFEAEERSTRDEPGWPASAVLWTAKVGGVDIAEILSDEQRDEIEVAFLNQTEEF